MKKKTRIFLTNWKKMAYDEDLLHQTFIIKNTKWHSEMNHKYQVSKDFS